jgi:cytochrome c oxidase assembly factor CtaG
MRLGCTLFVREVCGARTQICRKFERKSSGATGGRIGDHAMTGVLAWLLLNAAVMVVRVVVTSEWFRSRRSLPSISDAGSRRSDAETDRLQHWVVR